MSRTFEMRTEMQEMLYLRIGNVASQSDSPKVEETLHNANSLQPSQLTQTTMQLPHDILQPVPDAHPNQGLKLVRKDGQKVDDRSLPESGRLGSRDKVHSADQEDTLDRPRKGREVERAGVVFFPATK
jgi:hypothetical protein